MELRESDEIGKVELHRDCVITGKDYGVELDLCLPNETENARRSDADKIFLRIGISPEGQKRLSNNN